MPIYHFTVRDGTDRPDPEPFEMLDLATAKSHAAMLAGELLRDADGQFWKNSHWRIEVADEDGSTLCSIDIAGADGGRR